MKVYWIRLDVDDGINLTMEQAMFTIMPLWPTCLKSKRHEGVRTRRSLSRLDRTGSASEWSVPGHIYRSEYHSSKNFHFFYPPDLSGA